jgi:hypothetical protein
MKMLKSRTRLLITLSGLAPAAILLIFLDFQAANSIAFHGNGIGMDVMIVDVEPNVLYPVMLWVGIMAFLAAIVSTILDVRRSHS